MNHNKDQENYEYYKAKISEAKDIKANSELILCLVVGDLVVVDGIYLFVESCGLRIRNEPSIHLTTIESSPHEYNALCDRYHEALDNSVITGLDHTSLDHPQYDIHIKHLRRKGNVAVMTLKELKQVIENNEYNIN